MINKLIYNKTYRIIFLILLITVQAGIFWSGIGLGNTFLWWFIDFLLIFTILQIKRKSYKYPTVDVFLLWMIIGTIRGVFVAENYWEYKQLVTGFLYLILPIFVYLFDKPDITLKVLRYWFKFAIPLFVVFLFFIRKGAYHFFLGPVFFIGCFIPIIPKKKWKFIFLLLLFGMLIADLGARSQVIKSAVVLLIAIGVFFRKYISIKILRIIHWSFYIIPIFLLYLGISGKFNVFEDLFSEKGKYIRAKVVNGEIIEEDLSSDTRTFIYEEVIESALKHNYVLFGRTPARGNDSVTFGYQNAEELKIDRYERHANELCHTNIFTWLGIVGVLLYSLIYIYSSYLSVYKSNNIYIKFIGCFIAFRWAYGWIEDANTFSIMNISLWMMIAIGLSCQFRMYNNNQMEMWIKQIFK